MSAFTPKECEKRLEFIREHRSVTAVGDAEILLRALEAAEGALHDLREESAAYRQGFEEGRKSVRERAYALWDAYRGKKGKRKRFVCGCDVCRDSFRGVVEDATE